MRWPDTPVESHPGAFTPPFCPWAACGSHRGERFAWRFHGSFSRRDGSGIPRFRCRACRRTFSTQTFSCTYYLKRPDLSVPIAASLQGGSAHRQIARTLRCAPHTVTRRAARLGRHALLLHARCLDRLPEPREPLVYDDFETFSYAQDFPFGLGTAAGQRSAFVFDLDAAPHPRRGRMTPTQRLRQARLRAAQRVPGDQSGASFTRWLDRLTARWPRAALELVTDDQPAYRRALRRHPERARLAHRVYPNPRRGPKGSPRAADALARDCAMFEMDLLHLIARHSLAHHRRETIAFGRRINALMERAFLFAVWRNLVKARSERRRSATPAMTLGLTSSPWSWEQVFARRLFPWRQNLPAEWGRIYFRELASPGPERQAPHSLIHAT